MKRLVFLIFIASIFLMPFQVLKAQSGTEITPNQFKKGSDSDRIEAAIESALKSGDNSIEIPRYDKVHDKAMWLIDRAILLPSNFTLILKDCLVRLAPGVQDNIITNSGARTVPLVGNENISIIGIGNPILSGGLECHYENPGDNNGYKTLGILLYNTNHFIIEGIRMEETQGWAISVENGSAYGRISNIEINSYSRFKYGQDGIDIRKGCHDILIENITGTTGDDLIALTGLRDTGLDWRQEVRETREGKRKPSAQVGGRGWRENDDIYNIIIKNIKGTKAGCQCCSLIRLLNHDGIKMYNIFINDVMDTAKEGEGKVSQAILIGDQHYWKKKKNQLGETSRIFINNVLTNAPTAIRVAGTLKDSRFTNINGYYDKDSTQIDFNRWPSNGLIMYEKKAELENVYIDAHQF